VSQSASYIVEDLQPTLDMATLPKGWRWVRLEEVVSPRNGYWGKGEAFPSSTEITVLGVGNITNDGAIRVDGAQPRYLSPYEQEAIAFEGDILVVKSSGSATNIRSGKAGLCPPELSGTIACSNFMIRLVVKREEAEPYLLWQILNSNDAKKFIRLIAGSTTYPNIKWENYKNFSFLLPSITEQQRIAAILNEQLTAVARARAAVEAQLEAAQDLPAAYMREVFDNTEARDWTKKRIGDVALSVQNGIYKAAEHYGHGHPFLRMYNVQNDSWMLNLDRLALVNLEGKEEQIFALSRGDLLISRVNSFELVGKCAWVNSDAEGFVFENMLIRVRLDSSVNSLFVAQQMAIDAVRKQIESVAKRAIGQASINSADLRAIEIALPALDIQERIAHELSARVAGAKQELTALKDQLRTINKLPAALLRQAFTGKL